MEYVLAALVFFVACVFATVTGIFYVAIQYRRRSAKPRSDRMAVGE